MANGFGSIWNVLITFLFILPFCAVVIYSCYHCHMTAETSEAGRQMFFSIIRATLAFFLVMVLVSLSVFEMISIRVVAMRTMLINICAGVVLEFFRIKVFRYNKNRYHGHIVRWITFLWILLYEDKWIGGLFLEEAFDNCERSKFYQWLIELWHKCFGQILPIPSE